MNLLERLDNELEFNDTLSLIKKYNSIFQRNLGRTMWENVTRCRLLGNKEDIFSNYYWIIIIFSLNNNFKFFHTI